MAYTIRWVNNGVFIELKGKVSSKDLGHINNRLYADERYDQIQFQVLDLMDAEVDITKEELIEISSLDAAAARWNNSLRMAMLSRNATFREWIQTYYTTQLSKTHRKIGTFANHDDAMAWLQV